jgi:hypothetical protein
MPASRSDWSARYRSESSVLAIRSETALRASTDQLTGLPPAFSSRRKPTCYATSVNDFVVLDALGHTQAAIAATSQAVGYLRRVLGPAARE